MTIFPKETLDYIDTRLQAYFSPHRHAMTYKDARTLIDYAGSPAPEPHSIGAMDYSTPRVAGGGRTRPTSVEVDMLLDRLEADRGDSDAWGDVCAELMRRCEAEPDAERIIRLAYGERRYEDDICQEMDISQATYYNYRAVILGRAAVLAVQDGLLKY